jgi:hypothetical protein
MPNNRRRVFDYKKIDKNDAFCQERVLIPHETRAFLKDLSQNTGITMSRLIAIAIDNERDQGEAAFHYPVNLPKTEYVEYVFADEAKKIYDFLVKFPTGTAKDTLMLCRRDFGIKSRSAFCEGLRELLKSGVVEEFKSNTFGYVSKEGTRLRVVGAKRPKKFKRIEGEPTRHQRKIEDDDIDRGDEK